MITPHHAIRVTTLEGEPLVLIGKTDFPLRAVFVDQVIGHLYGLHEDGLKHDWEVYEVAAGPAGSPECDESDVPKFIPGPNPLDYRLAQQSLAEGRELGSTRLDTEDVPV